MSACPHGSFLPKKFPSAKVTRLTLLRTFRTHLVQTSKTSKKYQLIQRANSLHQKRCFYRKIRPVAPNRFFNTQYKGSLPGKSRKVSARTATPMKFCRQLRPPGMNTSSPVPTSNPSLVEEGTLLSGSFIVPSSVVLTFLKADVNGVTSPRPPSFRRSESPSYFSSASFMVIKNLRRKFPCLQPQARACFPY